MKKLSTLLILICLLTLRSEAQSWQWLKALHEKGGVSTNYTRYCPSGNLIYVQVKETPSLETRLSCFSSNGDLLWKKNIPELFIKDLSVDSYDNLYFCGYFRNTLQWENNNFYASGNGDAIAGVLNSSGDLQKHLFISTGGFECINSIALGVNAIYVGGTFTKSFSLNNQSYHETSAPNTFVLKLDMNLNAQAGFQTESTCCSGSSAGKIAVSPNQSVYLMAAGDSYVRVGSDSCYFNDEGSFLVKLSSSLQLQWTHVLSTHWINGVYLPEIKFDAGENPALLFRDGGGGGSMRTISVHKFSQSNGAVLWKAQLPVNNDAVMDADNSNTLWVAGNFTSFTGPVCLSIVKLTNDGKVINVIRDSSVTHYISTFSLKNSQEFFVSAQCRSGSLGSFGCSGQDSLFLAYYGPGNALGINRLAGKNEFVLHPNPSTGKITINNPENYDYRVKVFNMLGEEVKSGQSHGDMEIDLSGYEKGVYLFEIKTGSRKIVKRVSVN